MAGFKPVRKPNPADLITCVHLVGDTVRLGKGDPVKIVTGSVAIGSGPVVQAVARSATTESHFGVVVACEQQTVVTGFSLDRTHCPASTAMYIKVLPIKQGDEFEIAEDADGGSVATTDVGKNINIATAADCNATTGQSAYLADSSTAATTNTHDLCIRGFAKKSDNVPGSSATLVVSFNKIQDVNQATGV